MFHRFFSAAVFMAAGMLTALPASAQQSDPENPPDCLQLVPGAVSVSNTPVTLRLRIVMDGVGMDQAQQALAKAQAAYSPLNISISPSYESASFTNTDSSALIDEAKRHFGGQRPAGTDAVYVITSKDLVSGGSNTVAGQTDCIGGVAFSDKAFAVGEALADAPINAGVVTLEKTLAAKVLGHELGHLLGAQHHYANCGEAAPSGDGPCTLMFNDVSLQGLKFSTLNASVIRGAAQTYVGGASTAVVTPAAGPGGGSGQASSGSGSGGGGGTFSLLLAFPLLAAVRKRRRVARM